ncbi:hypothetical protein M431DRAFT_507664 [Trichoderma harzianum CBS 226.95]|uniref:Uncharacterized protein n=1 Tax=Trichoderma harzianum CBS 226.95 TaxID=983964 RepID=A0A2T4AFX8_TRIHA|nr:hypothetical protein M431DRAFT_507664 [Trichoderma harzianum CBS 226.95]PTB55995.1 hypothetical protein M431DRAFT_507664 [Trichoderma harzianum CBS 226.95]
MPIFPRRYSTWSPHVPLVRTKTVRLRYDRAISKLPSAQANAFPRYHQQPNSVTPNAILPVLVPDIKEERSKIRNKADKTQRPAKTPRNLTLRLLPPKTQNLRPSETPVLPRFLPRMIRTLGSLPSPDGPPKIPNQVGHERRNPTSIKTEGRKRWTYSSTIR